MRQRIDEQFLHAWWSFVVRFISARFFVTLQEFPFFGRYVCVVSDLAMRQYVWSFCWHNNLYLIDGTLHFQVAQIQSFRQTHGRRPMVADLLLNRIQQNLVDVILLMYGCQLLLHFIDRNPSRIEHRYTLWSLPMVKCDEAKTKQKKRMIIIERESDNNSKNESVRTLTPLTQANTTVPWESRNGLWYNWPRSWMHSADCIWQAAVKSLVRKWTADVAFFSISRRSDFTSSQVHATCLDFLHWIKHGWHSLAPLDILGLCVSFEECPLHACLHVTL